MDGSPKQFLLIATRMTPHLLTVFGRELHLAPFEGELLSNLQRVKLQIWVVISGQENFLF